jgi:hypothetical protein
MSDRRYDGPPRNRRALEQRLRNVIPDTELQQRARRQLGYIALAATLMRRDRLHRALLLANSATAGAIRRGWDIDPYSQDL